MLDIEIIDVTVENVAESGIYCIKDKKSPGYNSKVEWFKKKINHGLKIKIAIDKQFKQLGFIEYIPSELAWRPIIAENYYFIHCIALFVKEAKQKMIGSRLINECKNEAILMGKSGVCVVSSDGPWMANKNLFLKNGFSLIDKKGRFELLISKFNNNYPQPKFADWQKGLNNFAGWHLIYSDQCPWHQKSVTDIKQSAIENGIELKVKRLNTPQEAQNAPSGFGTFCLIKDGKLLEDHYLSRTRFENIIKQQMLKT